MQHRLPRPHAANSYARFQDLFRALRDGRIIVANVAALTENLLYQQQRGDSRMSSVSLFGVT